MNAQHHTSPRHLCPPIPSSLPVTPTSASHHTASHLRVQPRPNEPLDGALHRAHVHASAQIQPLVQGVPVSIFLGSPRPCPPRPRMRLRPRLVLHSRKSTKRNRSTKRDLMFLFPHCSHRCDIPTAVTQSSHVGRNYTVSHTPCQALASPTLVPSSRLSMFM